MFWTILLWAASFVLNLILSPKPQNARPESLDKFTAPVVEEGLEIPVLFGTEYLKGPNVVWYGDLVADPIKGERKYGLFGPKVTIGFKYKLGMHMVLCHAVPDEVRQIWVGEKLAWGDIAFDTGAVLVNAPDLFGGDESEGGVVGPVEFLFGQPGQGQDAYLVAKMGAGALTPAFRGVLSVVLASVYLGNNTYIKPWEFFVKRIHKTSQDETQWYDAKAAVPDSAVSVPTATGDELVTASYMNNENTLDTNGSYIAVAGLAAVPSVTFDNLVHVWNLTTDPPTEQTRSYSTMTHPGGPIGLGSIFITDDDEVIVRTSGDGSGTTHTWLEFLSAADLTMTTQAPIDLNPYMVSLELNFGFMAAQYGDHMILRPGPGTLFYNQPFIILERSASVWGVTSSHADAFTIEHSAMDMGPNYGYAIGSGSQFMTLLHWNGVWAQTDVDLNADLAGSIVSVCYSSASNEVVLLAGGHLYVYNEDLSVLQRQVAVTGAALTSRRMGWGTDSVAVFFSSGSGSIKKYSVADLSIQLTIDLASTAFANESEMIASGSWFLRNNDTGGFVVSGHAVSINWWPNPQTDALDMNPAHIIRECLTDRTWGMGYNDSDIDDDSFTYAADTLYDENFGLTILWTREETIEEFISIILSHIDAYLYVRRDTGKFYLKLVRNDYVIADLPVIDEDDVIGWEEVTHRQPGEAVNSVVSKYTDRRTKRGEDAAHSVDNIAQIQQFGERIAVTRFYPGISRGGLAARVGERDLRSLGSGIISGTIICKRTVEGFYPGDVFRLVSSRHELEGEIMRVTSLEFGDGRENEITIKFVQDIFRINVEELLDTSAGDWENPVNPPSAVINRLIWEMPYRELYQSVGSSDTATLLAGDPDVGLLQASGQRPTSDALDAYIYSDGVKETTMTFSPAGTTDAAVGALDTSITLEDYDSLTSLPLGTLGALVGSTAATTEIVKVTAISTATLTISRGMLDTVPQAHDAGTVFLAFDDFGMSDYVQRTSGGSVGVKLVTHTLGGVLSLTLAPTDTLVFDSRAVRPFRPADVQVEGQSEGPVDATALADVDVTWAERNRLLELSTFNAWTDPTVAAEVGQTTIIEVTDPTGTSVVTTYSGLTGTSYNVPLSAFSGASGFIRVGSERDGYREWQAYEIEVLIHVEEFSLSGDALFLGLEELTFGSSGIDSGAGASAGVGVASGVGASTTGSTGAASGTGSASAVGASTSASAGSAAGIGDASAVGDVV